MCTFRLDVVGMVYVQLFPTVGLVYMGPLYSFIASFGEWGRRGGGSRSQNTRFNPNSGVVCYN